MIDLSTFSAPLILAALTVLALAALGIWDLMRANSPKARMARRLVAAMARFSASDAHVETIGADLFRRASGGRFGDITAQIADLSMHLGGRKALRVLFIGTALAGLGASALAAVAGLNSVSAAALGGAAGVLAFNALRAELTRRWRIRFLDQLIEGVDLLSRAVQSGYAVPAAIRLVSDELPEPVGPVFGRIADEDDLGVEFRDILTGAARRVAVPDFTFLTSALMLQRETGGQLAETLGNLQTLLRRRREARLKLRAMTAEGRVSANVVGAVPIVAGLATYFMNPEGFTATLASPTGQTMFAVAGALLVVGMLITRAMTRPQA